MDARWTPTIAGAIAALHRGCAERLAFFAICPDHRFTMRESPYLRSIPRQLPWVLGLAIVMAVTGPFGIYSSPSLGVRLVYFGTTAVLIWLQVLGFAAAAVARSSCSQRWSIAARMALAGVLAAIPGTIEIIVLLSGWCGRRRFAPPWRSIPQTAFLTVVISVMIGLFIEQRLHANADNERARVARAAGGRRAQGRRARLLPPRAAGARPRSSGPGDGGPLPAHPHRARQRPHPAAPA